MSGQLARLWAVCFLLVMVPVGEIAHLVMWGSGGSVAEAAEDKGPPVGKMVLEETFRYEYEGASLPHVSFSKGGQYLALAMYPVRYVVEEGETSISLDHTQVIVWRTDGFVQVMSKNLPVGTPFGFAAGGLRWLNLDRDSGTIDVYTIPNGEKVAQLEAGADRRFAEPWSIDPSGKYLLVSVKEKGLGGDVRWFQLWQIEPTHGAHMVREIEVFPLTKEEATTEGIEAERREIGGFSFSGNGRKLAVWNRLHDELQVLTFPGLARIWALSGSLGARLARVSPVLSFDGDHLAFVLETSNGTGEHLTLLTLPNQGGARVVPLANFTLQDSVAELLFDKSGEVLYYYLHRVVPGSRYDRRIIRAVNVKTRQEKARLLGVLSDPVGLYRFTHRDKRFLVIVFEKWSAPDPTKGLAPAVLVLDGNSLEAVSLLEPPAAKVAWFADAAHDEAGLIAVAWQDDEERVQMVVYRVREK